MRLKLIATLLPGLVLGAAPAHAHAFLDRASPRVGSTVRSAPSEVSLWFTQSIEPSFSSAQVRNASGARVDQGAHVDGSNRALLHVPVSSLPPGTYKVHWRVLSVDTHTTEGNFSFRVGQ
jgi:methionine-rich copper-binding protein CopC